MSICHKCKQNKDASQLRTYRLSLKNNVSQNSFLARMNEVQICLSCDSARTTNIIKFLEQ